ncbi:hypothetical protein Cgig2_012219 [Carnegiea gigantea]|uniref:RNase H type-1 domain-containing protein n=1 Tax=Carnegiea gigantea TaxID=171969 RepID=A0A9Q1QQF9_9CARY|nr:hypothetical protein Cgig2_012219 [Carnegiea gigantea]
MLMGELNILELGYFAAVLWEVWNARSKFLFRNQDRELGSLSMRAMGFVDGFRAAQSKLQAPEPVLRHLWKPLQARLWKLNFDAGRVGEEGFRYRFIVMDAMGGVLGSSVGFLSVIVEGDNLLLMNYLQSGECPNTYFGILAKEILALSLSFLFVSWSHVRQEGNRVAHLIAHYQPLVWDERLWLDDSPKYIIDLAAVDWCKFTKSDK